MVVEKSAQGVVKSFNYDKLGHIVSSTVYATRSQTIDNLELLKSSNDRTNHFIYDNAGRERYRLSSKGRIIERRYDNVGNVIAEIKHEHILNLSDFNEDQIQKKLVTKEDHSREVDFNYDAVGRLISQVNPKGSVTQYSYDATGNVLTKTEANKAVWTYKYNEVNQLIETRSPETLVGQERRSIISRDSYDSFGNLISKMLTIKKL